MTPRGLLDFAVSVLVASPIASADYKDRLLPDDYLNLLRIDLRAAKASVVGEALELSAHEAEVFWPIYREYDGTLAKINSERISVLRDYTANYATFDDDKARDLSRRTFDFMRKRLDLLERYSRKIEKELSPTLAARFAQIESQMLMLVDVQLASDLPLIPRQAVLSQIGEN